MITGLQSCRRTHPQAKTEFLNLGFNSLPNNKIFDWSKLKALADNKINVTEKLKFGLECVENIVGNGGKAGYQHFFLFPQCFQKISFSRSL